MSYYTPFPIFDDEEDISGGLCEHGNRARRRMRRM